MSPARGSKRPSECDDCDGRACCYTVANMPASIENACGGPLRVLALFAA